MICVKVGKGLNKSLYYHLSCSWTFHFHVISVTQFINFVYCVYRAISYMHLLALFGKLFILVDLDFWTLIMD